MHQIHIIGTYTVDPNAQQNTLSNTWNVILGSYWDIHVHQFISISKYCFIRDAGLNVCWNGHGPHLWIQMVLVLLGLIRMSGRACLYFRLWVCERGNWWQWYAQQMARQMTMSSPHFHNNRSHVGNKSPPTSLLSPHPMTHHFRIPPSVAKVQIILVIRHISIQAASNQDIRFSR